MPEAIMCDPVRYADTDLSIKLDYDWERRNWMRWLGCSEEELLHAVESVGNDCDNVRRFLRQAR